MSGIVLNELPPYAPTTLAASNVGVWIRDADRDVVYCDAVTSHIFGLGEVEGAKGVSLDRLRGMVHPEDRVIHDKEVERSRSQSGLIVFEYRVLTPSGDVRWVLVRGRYDPSRPEQPLNAGRGIVIDITESKLDEDEDRAFFAHRGDGDEPAVEPLHRACDHALALWGEIDAMDETVPGLSEAADMVLLLLARRLALDVPRGDLNR